MTQPSDTPPDGDFVAYIERLTGANAADGPREDLLKPRASAPAGTPFAASTGMPSVKTLPDAVASLSFLGHLKWLVVAWFATQALARWVPGAGFLFIPGLLAYVGWVIFKINRHSSGALLNRARALALQAVEEAKKSSSFPKNKP